jgi:hypothetical protein
MALAETRSILRALGVLSLASAVVLRVTVGRARIVVQDGKCLLCRESGLLNANLNFSQKGFGRCN